MRSCWLFPLLSGRCAPQPGMRGTRPTTSSSSKYKFSHSVWAQMFTCQLEFQSLASPTAAVWGCASCLRSLFITKITVTLLFNHCRNHCHCLFVFLALLCLDKITYCKCVCVRVCVCVYGLPVGELEVNYRLSALICRFTCMKSMKLYWHVAHINFLQDYGWW